MARKRLLWQIFPPTVLVIILTIIASGFFVSHYLKAFYTTQALNDLNVRSHLVLKQLRPALLANNLQLIKEQCRILGDESRSKITVISTDGTVIADSKEDPATMDNHGDREEVAIALSGKEGTSARLSKKGRKRMLYAALPLLADQDTAKPEPAVLGVIRLSIPPTSLDLLMRDVTVKMFLASLILLLLAVAATLFVSRRISRPLEDMQHIAERFGRHDFNKKISIADGAVSKEVAGLAEALNQMAVELDERVKTVTQQKNELEAVFKSMVEAVIVIDQEERIEHMNEAAFRLLGSNAHRGIGKPIVETVRHAGLLKFVREALKSQTPISRDEIVFGVGATGQHFNASGTSLYGDQGQHMGALIVLYDVTRMRRLEDMRREFVANVSHELKTPITSIMGFVETICDQAPGLPDDMERFLHIVLKQANRLNAIIDDLLSLSRIEQEAGNDEIELHPGRLTPILRNCLEAVSIRASEKHISLPLRCGDTVSVLMNARLLEQAVTNLLINAIKYSAEHSEVRLEVHEDQQEVTISVTDSGCGIAKEHLPRIFERFYRSDKARSRKLGGTGLGLAIVKHIVQAHGGSVTVKSDLGKGSVFTLHLPRIEQSA
ncbi:MAG: PAS domain-containing protein [Proteobacteria bacterium]|nr:PAS domain-containing protein [Pseudomonadota bacterium]